MLHKKGPYYFSIIIDELFRAVSVGKVINICFLLFPHYVCYRHQWLHMMSEPGSESELWFTNT